jgi:hypothetical protein
MPVKGCRGTLRTSAGTSSLAERFTHLQSSPHARTFLAPCPRLQYGPDKAAHLHEWLLGGESSSP